MQEHMCKAKANLFGFYLSLAKAQYSTRNQNQEHMYKVKATF